MKTSNAFLLKEIDSIEELLGVDANELFLVKEIDRLTEELSTAIKLIDDGDRFSQTDVGYHNSPYCAQVREFLFKHGVVSDDERPILKYEDVNDIKEENQKLREALVGLLECKGILTSDKDCVISAKQLLEQTK